jgi:hypothetical protein
VCPVFSFVWFDAGCYTLVVFIRLDVVKDELIFSREEFHSCRFELRRVRRELDAIRRDNALLTVELRRKMALLFALRNDQFALRYQLAELDLQNALRTFCHVSLIFFWG